MEQEISKSQIDRLGKRLKLGKTEDDLRLLEQYRHSFRAAHELVYQEIRKKLLLEPTKRRTKTMQSIVDKLRRGSIKLTQIQDIAGCRIVTKDIANQDKIVDQLKTLFTDNKIKDRREKPSHGYRAVHIIVFVSGKAVEIQVRTELQDLWAELSEKYSDIVDQNIKYGGGNDAIRELLIETSSLVSKNELGERNIGSLQKQLITLQNLVFEMQESISRCQLSLDRLRIAGLPAQSESKFIEDLVKFEEEKKATTKETLIFKKRISSIKKRQTLLRKELFKLLADKVTNVENHKEQS